MQLLIAAIGKMRAGPEAAIISDYQKRTAGAGRQIGFSGPEIFESEAPKNLTGAKRRQRDGALLLGAIPNEAHVIVLDEHGRAFTSQDLAGMLGRLRDDGISAAAFLIGGADGHGPEIKARAAQTLSFGAATWPHMLVRVMLAEQLYRAMTILSGHPYHRQ